MKGTDDLTVVIPAWDLGAELDECLDSIKAQPIPCRILVVDNASKRPLPRRQGVRYLRLSQRVTVGAARNAGLAAVETPYVLFMDGDDVLLPDSVPFLMRRLIEHPRAVASAGRNVDWNPRRGSRKASTFPPGYAYQIQRFKRLFAILNMASYCFPVIAVVIRTDAARRAGGFPDFNDRENWLFSMTLCFQGRVLLHKRPVKLYRTGAERKTLSARKKRPLQETLRVIDHRMESATVPRWVRAMKRPIRRLQVRYLTYVHQKRWSQRRDAS